MWRSRLYITSFNPLISLSKLKGLLKVRVSSSGHSWSHTLVCIELTLLSEPIFIIDGKSLGLLLCKKQKKCLTKVTRILFPRNQNNNPTEEGVEKTHQATGKF